MRTPCNPKILVVGGAGYIGSHMCKLLSRRGYRVVVFDNLSSGHKQAVRWGELVVGDLSDRDALRALFAAHDFSAVMHFAARSLVGESVRDPALYYQNNVIGTHHLLEAMRTACVTNFIFSSTAAIFGNPVTDRIDEDHPQQPINPYGQSKRMVETMLRDYAQAYGLNSVALRYFNAAGADPEAEIGELHEPETHLIPNILRSVQNHNSDSLLKVFGNDYATRDGTCVRDYVHVNDLCRAHLLALDFLHRHTGAHAFNLGNGSGFTVLEVLQAAEAVVGQTIPYEITSQRAGDPPTLVADSHCAQASLAWKPQWHDVQDIIASAWKWQRKLQATTDTPAPFATTPLRGYARRYAFCN